MGKRYDKEFKIEAVLLASEPGNTQAQIERNLGLGQGHQPMEAATKK
jgi:transposase-like protein